MSIGVCNEMAVWVCFNLKYYNSLVSGPRPFLKPSLRACRTFGGRHESNNLHHQTDKNGHPWSRPEEGSNFENLGQQSSSA